MKTLLASALAASVLFTGAAHASTVTLDQDAYNYVANIDASKLTDQQISSINNTLYSGDSYNEVRSMIRGIIN